MKTTLLASGKFFTFLLLLLIISNASFGQSPSDEVIFQNVNLVQGQKTYVQLNWKGNKNVSYFLIEKSSDNKNFTQCALVFTGEDESLVDFNYRDRSVDLASSSLYYRIGIVNQAKEIKYLPVKTINFAKADHGVAEVGERR